MGITWTELKEFLTTEVVLMYTCTLWGIQLLWNMLVEVAGSGIALGIEMGTMLISHFPRNHCFLSVICPDPSTPIQ